MGAWGDEIFQNDASLDFLDQMEAEGYNPVSIRYTLEKVANWTEYLEVDEGCEGLVAAELVAAALGKHHPSRPELKTTMQRHAKAFGASDLQLAIKAVKRVLAEDSEINGLWSEGYGDNSKWHQDVNGLLQRLGYEPKTYNTTIQRDSDE